jgi:hypothetical protein
MASSSKSGKAMACTHGWFLKRCRTDWVLKQALLVDLFEAVERSVTDTVLMRSVERFDRRLVEEVSKLRTEMLQGDAARELS